MTPVTNRKNLTAQSDKKPLLLYITTFKPNFLVRITLVFIVVDFFAFQKQLSFLTAYFLIIIPLVLFAATNFLWFLRKELPIFHPYFGYTGLFDKEQKANWALAAFIMTIGLIILITYLFPSLYDPMAQTHQQ